MSSQGLEVIDKTVHLTHEWVNELAERLGWGSRRSALRLLRVTLHHIRDHLPVDEMAQLSAQLPLLIRGMYYEGWVPTQNLHSERTAKSFNNAIADQVQPCEEYRGDRDILCVFDLLNARLSEGEIEDIRANLPGQIRALWPSPYNLKTQMAR